MINKIKFLHRIIDGSLKFKNKEVDFLIGGVQKGGTTALDSYLRTHSEVCLAEVKEVHFFDNEFVFRFPGFVRDAWYQSYFHDCESNIRKGESTPIYLWWHNAMKRIYDYNPKVKLVFIFRDPVSRAYSHWNMEVQRGNEGGLNDQVQHVTHQVPCCHELLLSPPYC
ncbi:sulfotransferase domain-containing protein [Chromohalobacter sp. 48-RD10]|uniref:sulfotransferase domain-containing protein n=1 Tax=Chromohalobacter sp. 48-RD10 TaxID=2994063 RepID=UPI00246957D7|nr:sulfotransferase domain-containing protein [Chromohalobacter sp. 48-RD10]